MNCALFVDFKIKPGRLKEFRRMVDENASMSLQKEPGCLRFDVLEPRSEDNRVLLYEIYTCEEAFELHLQSEHYRAFADASEGLCVSKAATVCALVFEPRK